MTAVSHRRTHRETRRRRAPGAGRALVGVEHGARPQIVLAGFTGSVLLTLGSLGSGAPPVYDPVSRTPVLGLLRGSAGERFSLALVYVGLAVLGMAWLHLGRSVHRRELGIDLPSLRRVGLLWGGPLLIAVPLFSRDLYSYAAQAQITRAGLDPYSVGPAAISGPFLDEISRLWVDTPAPYGPLWLGLGRAVATVTGDGVLTTVFALRLLAVGGLLLMARYLPRLATACGVDARFAFWLGVLNPLVLIHFVAGGHNDALMLGLVVAGLAIAVEATEERWVAAGVALVRGRGAGQGARRDRDRLPRVGVVEAPDRPLEAARRLRAHGRRGAGDRRRDHRRDRDRLRLGEPAQRPRRGRHVAVAADRRRADRRVRQRRAGLHHVREPGDHRLPDRRPGRHRRRDAVAVAARPPARPGSRARARAARPGAARPGRAAVVHDLAVRHRRRHPRCRARSGWPPRARACGCR